MEFIILLLVFYIIEVTFSLGLFVDNPVSVNVNRIFPCTEYKSEQDVFVTMKKISKTATAFDANLTLKYPADERFFGVFELAKWSDGGWKHNIINLRCHQPVCECLAHYLGEMWYKLEDSFGMPRNKCPIAKGFYSLANHVVNFTEMAIRIPIKGRFLIKVKMVQIPTDSVQLCYKGEVEVKEIKPIKK